MFKNQKLSVHLVIGFAAMTLLIIILSFIAQHNMRVLSGLTTDLYDHPYAVTTAVLEAEANIIAIDRAMKAVENAGNAEAIAQIAAEIDPLEQAVIDKFNTIKERFLGDISQVEEVKNRFLAWKPVRDEVLQISLEQAEATGLKKTMMQVKVVRKRIAANEVIEGINAGMRGLAELSRDNAVAFLKDSQGRQKEMATMFTAVSAVAVIFGALLAYFITQGVSRPLKHLKEAMASLSQGNLETDIPFIALRNEMGEMARAVQVFKDNAVVKIHLEEEQEQQAQRNAAEKKRALMEMADSFEKDVKGVVDHVLKAAEQMRLTAKAMSENVEMTRLLSDQALSASTEMNDNVTTVAGAAEQLAQSVLEITRQVAEAASATSQASGQASVTNEQVSSLVDAADRIGQVVGLISQIAEQTNLLALNATIEAARAGEAGKGFAVVAGEVKGLAEQTSKATKDIKDQVAAIQAATSDSAESIKHIGKTIVTIDSIASAVAAAVEEQGHATTEIARGASQAALGTGSATSAMTGISNAASSTGNSASEVVLASEDLLNQSRKLRDQVEGFLNNVRAA